MLFLFHIRVFTKHRRQLSHRNLVTFPFPLCSVLFQALVFKCPQFCSLLRIPIDLSNVNSTLLIYALYKAMYFSPSVQHLIMPTHMAFTGSLLVSFFSIFSLGLFSIYSKLTSHSLLCCLSAANRLWLMFSYSLFRWSIFLSMKRFWRPSVKGPVLQTCTASLPPSGGHTHSVHPHTSWCGVRLHWGSPNLISYTEGYDITF